eukprot:4195565-Pyramimonas_sp.AAC.1
MSGMTTSCFNCSHRTLSLDKAAADAFGAILRPELTRVPTLGAGDLERPRSLPGDTDEAAGDPKAAKSPDESLPVRGAWGVAPLAGAAGHAPEPPRVVGPLAPADAAAALEAARGAAAAACEAPPPRTEACSTSSAPPFSMARNSDGTAGEPLAFGGQAERPRLTASALAISCNWVSVGTLACPRRMVACFCLIFVISCLKVCCSPLEVAAFAAVSLMVLKRTSVLV